MLRARGDMRERQLYGRGFAQVFRFTVFIHSIHGICVKAFDLKGLDTDCTEKADEEWITNNLLHSGLVPVHHAFFHHEHHTTHYGDVFQRITIERDDVGLHAARDAADAVSHAE